MGTAVEKMAQIEDRRYFVTGPAPLPLEPDFPWSAKTFGVCFACGFQTRLQEQEDAFFGFLLVACCPLDGDYFLCAVVANEVPSIHPHKLVRLRRPRGSNAPPRPQGQ